MVTARFGADGMSLLLLPGEAECRSPPRVRAAANHNPWFETAAGAESISQRLQLVTPPVRVYYCAVEDDMAFTPVLTMYASTSSWAGPYFGLSFVLSDYVQAFVQRQYQR